MEQLTNQRVADEIGSDVSSERRFSDLSDYEDAANESDHMLEEVMEVSGTPPSDDISCEIDRCHRPARWRCTGCDRWICHHHTLSNRRRARCWDCRLDGQANEDQVPEENSPKEFMAEDELGVSEGSTLNTAALETASQVEPEKENLDHASDQSSSSSSSDSSSSAPSETFERLMSPAVQGASASQDAPVMQNLFKVRGGKYHLGSVNSETHFICGTKVTPRASRQITSPAFFSPKCTRCFAT